MRKGSQENVRELHKQEKYYICTNVETIFGRYNRVVKRLGKTENYN